MNRDEIGRFDRVQHDSQFFAVGVARSVDGLDPFVKHLRAQLVEPVDEFRDGPDVSGDEARGQEHQIARLDGDLPVFVLGDARQGGQWFALGSGQEQDELVVGVVVDLVNVYECVAGNLEVAEFPGQFDVSEQALAADPDLSVGCFRQIEYFLHALDVAGKEGDQDASVGLAEYFPQTGLDFPLRQGKAFTLHIGRIGHEQLDARFRKFLEGLEVCGVAVQWVSVDLEIPGVHHAAHRGLDAQPVALDHGMADRKEVEGQIAQLDSFIGFDFPQIDIVQEIVLTKLVFHQSEGKPRTVDRGVHIWQQPGQGSDVVLMAVGQDDAFEDVFVFDDHVEAGDGDVHS